MHGFALARTRCGEVTAVVRGGGQVGPELACLGMVRTMEFDAQLLTLQEPLLCLVDSPDRKFARTPPAEDSDHPRRSGLARLLENSSGTLEGFERGGDFSRRSPVVSVAEPRPRHEIGRRIRHAVEDLDDRHEVFTRHDEIPLDVVDHRNVVQALRVLRAPVTVEPGLDREGLFGQRECRWVRDRRAPPQRFHQKIARRGGDGGFPAVVAFRLREPLPCDICGTWIALLEQVPHGCLV